MEMNSIPWSPILRYSTPLPMNRTPVSSVALQHKSVSSILRYARPRFDRNAPTQVCFVHSAVCQALFRSAVPSKQVGSR